MAIKGLRDPLFKVIPPFGGGQIEKTVQGTGAYMTGGTENKAGKILFKIEETPQNLIRSVLFGKYSTPEARQYFEQPTGGGVTGSLKSLIKNQQQGNSLRGIISGGGQHKGSLRGLISK
jgi:hypothetical protein